MKPAQFGSILLCIAAGTESCKCPYPTDQPHPDRAYVIFINDVNNLLLTTDDVEIAPLYAGIRPHIEGSGAGNDIFIDRASARRASELIGENPSFWGRGVWLNKAFFRGQVKGSTEVKMGNKPWLDLSTATNN